MTEHKFEFTHDWITPYFPLWEKVILPHRDRVKHILEIGCYEGRASAWFLQNFPNADLVCVDTFEGDADLKACAVDFTNVKSRWHNNTRPWHDRTSLFHGDSTVFLLKSDLQYDLVLVDGDHSSKGVLLDLMMSFHRLNPGGLMILDDYGWGLDRPAIDTPRLAIDWILESWQDRFIVLEKGYQVILQKVK